jgi:ABC-type hemin transport system ATPase subunit
VKSFDAAERDGSCDEILVNARGHIAATQTAGDVLEANLVTAAIGAEHHICALDDGADRADGVI